MEYLTKEVHEEFVKRINDQEARQDARLKLLENNVQQNVQLTLSVQRLADNMEIMANEQKSQGHRLEALEQRDGEKWKEVSKYIVTFIVGAVLSLVMKQIGL